jgi:hypothetical protein
MGLSGRPLGLKMTDNERAEEMTVRSLGTVFNAAVEIGWNRTLSRRGRAQGLA